MMYKELKADREAFRQYIFNADGNYLIGGQTVSEFITEADKLLYGRSF